MPHVGVYVIWRERDNVALGSMTTASASERWFESVQGFGFGVYRHGVYPSRGGCVGDVARQRRAWREYIVLY
jgi:hypothetical protein